MFSFQSFKAISGETHLAATGYDDNELDVTRTLSILTDFELSE